MTEAKLPREGVITTLWSHVHPNFEVRRAIYSKIPQSWRLAHWCHAQCEQLT